MRTDIMVDIETLGVSADSTIIQIAAVSFDITTGDVYKRFNQIANIELNERPLKVDGSTLKWWLSTDKELLKKLLVDNPFNKGSEDVLRSFHRWIINQNDNPPHDIYLWGNGPLFDNNMIKQQMESIGLVYPVFYRNDRDMRTLLELASQKSGVSEKEIKEQFNDNSLEKHNAIDDVLYQIRVAHYCHKLLMG